MAFDLQKLALQSQNGAGLANQWSYESSADAQAAIQDAGYFNDASDRLAVGDRIWVKDSAGVLYQCIVNSNTGGVVDTTDGVVLDATDGS
jgi:hypothetical protein